jgi:hypothetical protein
MFAVQAAALIVFAGSPAVPYAWPLDLPQVITSSFGEYRAGRFHAGIDLHTGGIGIPVRAPADGHVARVGCSPYGYGKALYLEINDGNLVVFGHLNGFAPAVQEYVHKAQHAAKNYTVNLTPEPSAFSVRRGDVVAFSGETGVGKAHLHYEIRDSLGCPINPRLLGIAWPDVTPPEIHKLLMAPGGPDATVNGDLLPAVINVRATGRNRYTCEAVLASGRVGFGLDVIDPENAGSSKLGVYTLRTVIGEKEIFNIRMDRFSYDNRENEIVSYYPFLPDQGCFLLQWRWPGNVCDIFQQTKSDGWCPVPSTATDVRIEAADADGNAAVITVPLQPDTRPAPPAPTKGGAGNGKVDIACVGTWLVVSATFPSLEPQSPVLTVDGAKPGAAFRRINDTTFRAAVIPDSGAREITLRVTHDRLPPFEQRLFVFHRGAPTRTVDMDGATVTVKSKSPYGTLYLRAFPAAQLSPAPFPIRGTAFRLWPGTMPIDDPVEIALPVPDGIQKIARAGIYRDCGPYWMLESDKRADDRFIASTRRLGVFAVLEDDKPPAISNIVVEKSANGAPRRPSIRATVSDVGSGVADVTVTCDGQWLLMAYDPERNRIEWEKDEDLPENPQELVWTVSDKAGNTTSVAGKFHAAGSKPPAGKGPAAKAPATRKAPSKPTGPRKASVKAPDSIKSSAHSRPRGPKP